MSVRVIVPDSHGSLIDSGARTAFLDDLKTLDASEIVMLGDHVDCAGLYSTHGINSREDRAYSYYEDIAATDSFLDEIQKRAPKAKIHYLEGNHEYRIKKWAAKNVPSDADVEPFIALNGPAGLLRFKERGIRFYEYDKKYMGLSIPNTIKLGKCYFTHGTTHAKHAASVTLSQFAANVVFGHVHRAMSVISRTIAADAIGAWCPGTLAQLQPIYFHSKPSDHTHGYGVQLVNDDGSFLHMNVPIVHGKSKLRGLKGLDFE